MTTTEQHLAELFVEMTNTHNPDVEHWDELNLMQLFQQIGALPPLDGPEQQS